jgi:hypothetical protein
MRAAHRRHRPNLLLVSPDFVLDRAVSFVLGACEPPFQFCALPGDLILPATRSGTLLLWDVAALTVPQQIQLFFWLGASRGDLQIVSVTPAPIEAMVDRHEFHDGLYYRLNVVRLDFEDAFEQAILFA